VSVKEIMSLQIWFNTLIPLSRSVVVDLFIVRIIDGCNNVFQGLRIFYFYFYFFSHFDYQRF